jgi:hypothetical protein
LKTLVAIAHLKYLAPQQNSIDTDFWKMLLCWELGIRRSIIRLFQLSQFL